MHFRLALILPPPTEDDQDNEGWLESKITQYMDERNIETCRRCGIWDCHVIGGRFNERFYNEKGEWIGGEMTPASTRLDQAYEHDLDHNHHTVADQDKFKRRTFYRLIVVDEYEDPEEFELLEDQHGWDKTIDHGIKIVRERHTISDQHIIVNIDYHA